LAFEQALDAKVARAAATILTQSERTILAVEALEREVNNGGYSQFFVNSSKEYVADIVAALERIVCRKTAHITAKAIAALNIKGPVTLAAVDDAMAQDDSGRDDALDECDSQYYRSGEAIADQLFAFIRSHQTEVRLP
jgi:hypothetical protein